LVTNGVQALDAIVPQPLLLPTMLGQGAAIGDVFVSTNKMYHDRRIPLPGFDKMGLGCMDSIPTPHLRAALNLKAGIVTSGVQHLIVS